MIRSVSLSAARWHLAAFLPMSLVNSCWVRGTLACAIVRTFSASSVIDFVNVSIWDLRSASHPSTTLVSSISVPCCSLNWAESWLSFDVEGCMPLFNPQWVDALGNLSAALLVRHIPVDIPGMGQTFLSVPFV